MSRIGKLPIEIPSGVNVTIEGRNIKVAGPKGELSFKYARELEVKMEGTTLTVRPVVETREAGSLYGLTRTIIANMVHGVSEGFEKKLEFVGVGYRAAMEGSDLVMHLGFSHPVRYVPREGIEIKVE